MRPFDVLTADTVSEALDLALRPSERGVRYIAGGTNLIDLMKEGVTGPETLIDLNHLGLDQIEEVEGGGLRLGALARNAQTAYHPLVRDRYPLLTAAILAGASPQIRNMATNGGNLLQRTRCYYFYDVSTPCNKREPGSGCSAIGGLTRIHAILGSSTSCVATHPSDMCVALAALDATVHVESVDGPKVIAFGDFHRLPGDDPARDNNLLDGDLITHLELPPAAEFRNHSAYLKIRDRASYAFGLVTVAAMLDVDGEVIRGLRVALGGVAHKPWRSVAAEHAVVGQAADAETFESLADALLDGATGQGDNDFKIPLARRAIVRALQTAKAGTVTNTGEELPWPTEENLS